MNGLQAGAARLEITPPVGVPTGGGGPDGYLATISVLDPLYVRALLLRSADRALLLLQADLLGLSRTKAEGIACAVSRRTGIPEPDILVACPQSHNAGCTFTGAYPDQVPDAFVNADHRRWYDTLEGRFADVAAAACAREQAVVAGLARGACPGVSSNRRARMKDGRISMAWYDPAPAGVASWGPDDPELVLVGFRSAADARPVALLWHFTGHPNMLWMLPHFSRDYPGVVEDAITSAIPGATALFLNGFCGNVDSYRSMGIAKEVFTYPFYKEPGRDLTPNIAAMQRLGQRLAAQVLNVWQNIEWDGAGWDELGLRRQRLACTVRGESPESRAHYEPFVDIAAARIGPVGLACAPFEPVVELGLWLKRHSPAPVTIPVGHSPYYAGYLPNRTILDEGGFESQTGWRGYAAGTGEAVAEGLRMLLDGLFPAVQRPPPLHRLR